MKPSSFTIRIPEPCHEDWDVMQPEARGKFCTSCSKPVFDFSNKTDAEIGEILMRYKDQKVCGHFKTTQVNRPLSLKIDLDRLPRNLSATKAFAVALFLVFGSLLFSCTNHHDQLIGSIEINTEQGAQSRSGYMMGKPLADPTKMITGDTLVQTCSPPDTTEHYINGDMRLEPIDIMGEVAVDEPDTGISLQPEEPMMLGLIKIVPEPPDTVISPPDTSARIRNDANNQVVNAAESEWVIYPNPGAGEFTLQYELQNPSDVRADLFDLGGAFIKTLVNVRGQHRGHYNIPLSAAELPNGIYLVNLIRDGKLSTGKLVLQR